MLWPHRLLVFSLINLVPNRDGTYLVSTADQISLIKTIIRVFINFSLLFVFFCLSNNRNIFGVHFVSDDLFNLSVVQCDAEVVAHHLLYNRYFNFPIRLANSSSIAFGNHTRNGPHAKRSSASNVNAILCISHSKCCSIYRYLACITFESRKH